MTLNWQEIGAQAGVVGSLFYLYHFFVFDNHTRRVLKEDEGTQAIVDERSDAIAEKKLKAFRLQELTPLLTELRELRRDVKELTKRSARLEALLELRMSKRKDDDQEIRDQLATMETSVSHALTSLVTSVFNALRRQEELIKHYNLHNQERQVRTYEDHTHEADYERFFNKIFTVPAPLKNSIAGSRRTNEDSGFLKRPSYRETITPKENTAENYE